MPVPSCTRLFRPQHFACPALVMPGDHDLYFQVADNEIEVAGLEFANGTDGYMHRTLTRLVVELGEFVRSGALRRARPTLRFRERVPLPDSRRASGKVHSAQTKPDPMRMLRFQHSAMITSGKRKGLAQENHRFEPWRMANHARHAPGTRGARTGMTRQNRR